MKVAERFQSLSMAEQIARALPIARRMIEGGIDKPRDEDLTIIDLVAELANDPALLKEYYDADEARASDLWDRLEAARTLGMALGLMLRPTFVDGGVQ